MIESEWLKFVQRLKHMQLDAYVVMPNHFHAILEIVGANVGQPHVGSPHVGSPHVGRPHVGRPQVGQPLVEQPRIGQPQGVAPTNKTLGYMVDAFESIATVEYIGDVMGSYLDYCK